VLPNSEKGCDGTEGNGVVLAGCWLGAGSLGVTVYYDRTVQYKGQFLGRLSTADWFHLGAAV